MIRRTEIRVTLGGSTLDGPCTSRRSSRCRRPTPPPLSPGEGSLTSVTHAADGILVTALPLLYDPNSHSLIGHVARANPHWRTAGAASVAIFAGPHAYISPGFYATKQETGKVVPTWNYDVLAVHGDLVAHDDQEWLRDLVTRLTNHHEQRRAEPWQITDAPETRYSRPTQGHRRHRADDHVGRGAGGDVQNQPERNLDGVVAGLRESAVPADHAVAERVAKLGSTNAKGRG